MIKKISLFLLFNYLFISFSNENFPIKNPTLVVVLMVKNEETVINATIQPFLREISKSDRDKDLAF